MSYDVKSRLFWKEEVENKERKFGSALSYFPAVLEKDGEEIPMLFTEDDLRRAMERAKKNMEDIPQKEDGGIFGWLF